MYLLDAYIGSERDVRLYPWATRIVVCDKVDTEQRLGRVATWVVPESRGGGSFEDARSNRE